MCVTARHTHTSIRAIAHTRARRSFSGQHRRGGRRRGEERWVYRWRAAWTREKGRKEWRLLDVAQEGDDELAGWGVEGGAPWQLGDGCVDIRRSVMQGAFLRDKWWRRQKRESISRRLALPRAETRTRTRTFSLSRKRAADRVPAKVKRMNEKEAISWGNSVSKREIYKEIQEEREEIQRITDGLEGGTLVWDNCTVITWSLTVIWSFKARRSFFSDRWVDWNFEWFEFLTNAVLGEWSWFSDGSLRFHQWIRSE